MTPNSTQVNLPNGEIRSQKRQDIYDTVTIAASESPIGTRSFFTNVQGKSKILTNLKQNGLLEGQVSFLIQGMKIEAHVQNPANALCLPLIMEHSYFNLKIGDKDWAEGNFRTIMGNLNAVYSIPAAGTERLYHQAGQSKFAGIVLRGDDALAIPALRSFRLDWLCDGMSAGEITQATPAATTKIAFLARLAGLMRNPVQ